MSALARQAPCIAALALAFALAAGAAQAACSRSDVSAAAAGVQVARAALLALPVKDMDTDVPVGGQAAITTMKTRLAALADAYEACASPGQDPQAAARDLTLLAGGPGIGDDNRYGRGLSFAVKRWGAKQDLIGIVAEIEIQCGADASLFLFSQGPDGWAPVLRWQAPPYAEVSGGFESFDYAVSPPDRQGRWFVAAKSIKPWCSSAWSSIRYAILRPGPSPSAPKVLLSRQDEIWYGGDDTGTLKVGAADVDLRFHASSIDSGVHNRLWIRRFAIEGDRLRRIGPVAASPRDFVDEWIVSPWLEASAWTEPAARSALRAEQARLKKIHHFDYDAVHRCKAPGTYQIKLLDDDTPHYLKVAAGPGYRMLAVSSRRDPACAGPNLLQTMTTR